MNKHKYEPGRLVSIPPHLTQHLSLTGLFNECDEALRWLADATICDVEDARTHAHRLGWFILWIVAKPIGLAYGPDADTLVRSWADTLRGVSNELFDARPNPAPDKTALILDNIENVWLKIDARLANLSAANLSELEKRAKVLAEKIASSEKRFAASRGGRRAA